MPKQICEVYEGGIMLLFLNNNWMKFVFKKKPGQVMAICNPHIKDELNYYKTSPHWVPCILNADQTTAGGIIRNLRRMKCHKLIIHTFDFVISYTG